MKQVILFLLLTLAATVYGQVPRELGTQGSGDMPMHDAIVEAPPDRKVAPDEVRGIAHEKDGKRSFVMGDESRKGLYDEINFVYNNSAYIAKKGNLYGIADKKGEVIVKMQYDSIGADYYRGLDFIAKLKGKYGKITSTGEIILPVKYDKIIAGNQDNTLVKNSRNETELIFNGQKKALNKKIDYAELYGNVTIVRSDGKFGVVKKEIIVPFEYDSIFIPVKDPQNIPVGANKAIKKGETTNLITRPHQNVLCLTIQKNNKYGLVNTEGTIIYPADNDQVYNAEAYGYYSVKKGSLYGIYFSKSKDKKKTEIEFDRISVDGYGAIMASKDKKMGIFNLDGVQVAPFEYDNEFIAQYTGVGYRISKNKKRGIIDNQGNVIVPPVYDDVSPISYSNRDLFKVRNGEKSGIVNRDGKMIIPVDFEYIDELNGHYLVITPERKVGLYDKGGNVVVPVVYKWITKTATPNSSILLLNKEDNSFNFLDKNNKIILPEDVSEYGYVLDEDKLKSPRGRMGLLYVKTRNGKSGSLNEISGTVDVPMVYDEIIQCTGSTEDQIYFSVRKDKKYGLINNKNEILIPVKYDAIDLSFAVSTADLERKENENNANDFQVVVVAGKKYGTVNLKDEVVIPIRYAFLQRISYSGLFKAKTGKQYQIIDKDGKLISKDTFDEVANFERVDRNYSDDYILQGLTFSKGKMRVMDSKGNFITAEKPMQPHIGYETFDELKLALIKALDSKNDTSLKEFADKIAPSEHILYYLKQNLFTKSNLYANVEQIRKKYLSDLLTFKQSKWNADTSRGYSAYKRSSLNVTDYTRYSDTYGIVTNTRTSDHAYGDTRFMEKLLRDAIKVNGYWVSTYFMKRAFDGY